MILWLVVMRFQVFKFENSGPFSPLQEFTLYFGKAFIFMNLAHRKKMLLSSQALWGCHLELEMSGRTQILLHLVLVPALDMSVP